MIIVPIPYAEEARKVKKKEKKTIINGSDKYQYPGNDHIP
jgi:hypothetical protein